MRARRARRTSCSSRSGSTAGLRAADAELAGALRRAGASVAVVAAAPPRERAHARADRPALGARRAARPPSAALAEHRPRAVVYSTTTAALLWPRPGAIRFDAPAAGNRPGPPRALAAPAGAPAPRAGAAAAALERRAALDEAAGRPAADRPSSSPSRSSRAGAAARPTRDIAASPTRPTRPRRASTACWRPGRAVAPAAGEELVVARPRTRRAVGRARDGVRVGRRLPGRRATARCCAARASSSPRRAARTTGSPSSRRSPTAACSSRRRRRGPTPRCRSRGALDPRLVGDDLGGAPARRARRPGAGLRRARAGRARAVPPRRRRRARSPPSWLPALVAEALRRPRARSLAQRRELGPGRVLATSAFVSHARRAVATPQRVYGEVRRAVGVGVDHDPHARLPRPRAAWTSLRSRRSGAGVDLEHRAGPRRGLDHALDVDRVGRRASRSCARWGGRSRRPAGARSAMISARSSRPGRCRRTCGRAR